MNFPNGGSGVARASKRRKKSGGREWMWNLGCGDREIHAGQRLVAWPNGCDSSVETRWAFCEGESNSIQKKFSFSLPAEQCGCLAHPCKLIDDSGRLYFVRVVTTSARICVDAICDSFLCSRVRNRHGVNSDTHDFWGNPSLKRGNGWIHVEEAFWDELHLQTIEMVR
jgi:hypothetical protein